MTISKIKGLVLFGTGDLARIAYEYFERDTAYEVVAFAVDGEFYKDETFCDLPVLQFNDIATPFPPDAFAMHVAVVYGDINRLRARKCAEAKEKGYILASYISPHAYVSKAAAIGEHAFIFENNVIQPNVSVGNNCIFWSGNHVGHDSKIGNNVFLSSHVVVSGHCDVQDNCFIGVNSTLANGAIIGRESWVSHGSVISGNVPPNSFVKSVQSDIVPLNETALRRALERAKA